MNVIKFICYLIIAINTSVTLAKDIYLNKNDDLNEAIQISSPKDKIILAPGDYKGNLDINKPIIITGTHKSRIIGDKTSNTIIINSDNVVIDNISIMGSGLDLSLENTGVFINKKVKNTIIKNNHIEDNLIGIYLKGSIDSQIIDNEIIGLKSYRVNDRGNGVQVWNSPGSVINGNHISYGRDGIFTTTSKNNKFTGNHFENVRYSIHYMYTKDSIVSDNYSKNNKIGYALMFSDNITAKNNISISDSERGIFSNFMNKSVIDNNIVLGPNEKCMMLYNSNYNIITNNIFKKCNIGIHYTAGSQNNRITNNNFINNHKQVKYVGTKNIEWSFNNKGNYWSDHIKFDLNTDGIADAIYHPNSITDKMLWKNSNTKVLLNSPIIQVLKWSQSHFPSLLPGGIYDSYPLLKLTRVIDSNLITKSNPAK